MVIKIVINQPYMDWNIDTQKTEAQNQILHVSALLGCHHQAVWLCCIHRIISKALLYIQWRLPDDGTQGEPKTCRETFCASVAYIFQRKYSRFHDLISTLCTVHAILKQSKDASLKNQTLDPSLNKDQVGESHTIVGALRSSAIPLHTFTAQF
jgi:hypothetical protein